MRNMCNWCLIIVQTLIPALWTGNSERSECAVNACCTKAPARIAMALARRSNLSLEASEALSLDDLEVHLRVMECDDVLGLPQRQNVENTDEVVFQTAVGMLCWALARLCLVILRL